MRKVILALLLVVGISFAYENLDSKSFYKMIQQEKNIVILDVRTPEEYDKDGHIPNSILIPVQVLPQHIKDLEKFKDKKILVYCRSGNRSSVASKFLEQNGFKNVYNLKYGIIDWKKEGLPVEYGVKK
ncbi:MAG: rhodanese-like domain-containing protein [Sulfurihydrogenibium sp.]|uniref:rhodanese-like domain-containing protein n=1 Tax=Sulfurihydrogenibium sp. TaxID=2053621 RepID=UPI003C7C536F